MATAGGREKMCRRLGVEVNGLVPNRLLSNLSSSSTQIWDVSDFIFRPMCETTIATNA